MKFVAKMCVFISWVLRFSIVPLSLYAHLCQSVLCFSFIMCILAHTCFRLIWHSRIIAACIILVRDSRTIFF